MVVATENKRLGEAGGGGTSGEDSQKPGQC
jgi:hypothetical protein